jgi:hypothetical protein
MATSKHLLGANNGHVRKRLNHAVIALVTSLVLLTSTAARADFLATVLYGGVSQTLTVCYVFNAGYSPILIVSAVIQGQFTGSSVAILGDSCTSVTLAPNQFCAIDASIDNTQAYSCRIEASGGAVADLRGGMDMRSGTSLFGPVLANSNLR